MVTDISIRQNYSGLEQKFETLFQDFISISIIYSSFRTNSSIVTVNSDRQNLDRKKKRNQSSTKVIIISLPTSIGGLKIITE